MSEAPAEMKAVEQDLSEPIATDFEYQVRLNVAIPLSWAYVLKKVGEHHYAWKCREVAKQGVVNGLHNTALFNQDAEFRADHPEPSTHPISWSDCDCMLKIMEQARYHEVDHDTIDVIRKWLHRTMEKLTARHAEISR